jgi:hypothetical protein
MARIFRRPTQIIAFEADGIGRQANEVRKQLKDIKTNVTFTETHLKLRISSTFQTIIFIGLTVKTLMSAEHPLHLKSYPSQIR